MNSPIRVVGLCKWAVFVARGEKNRCPKSRKGVIRPVSFDSMEQATDIIDIKRYDQREGDVTFK